VKYGFIIWLGFSTACLQAHVASKEVMVGSEETNETSAGMLLERAFYFLQLGNYSACADAFKAAIQTGDLNDSGRALAYWHIYWAQSLSKEECDGLDALQSFTVVAEDVLSENLQSDDFVEHFDLQKRLQRARAVLSAQWAKKSGEFGRSLTYPVRVTDFGEMAYFLEIAPPCDKASERTVSHEKTFPPNLQHVNVQCSGKSADYYFLLSNF
jgi:hypothetical protein